MTQAQLAEAVGMSQNNLSRLENPDYGKHTISSLKRIADALDVALVVRFVPFSHYIDWLSGTPRIDRGLSAQSLAVPHFDRDSGLQPQEGKLLRFPGMEGTPKPADQPGWLGGRKDIETARNWAQALSADMVGTPKPADQPGWLDARKDIETAGNSAQALLADMVALQVEKESTVCA